MMVFVYGTLKKGHGANGLMKGKFIGEGIASDMVLLTRGGFPVAFPSPGGKVCGEVYDIQDEEVLANLDRYEGAPKMFHRDTTTVDMITDSDNDRSRQECTMYVGTADFWRIGIEEMKHVKSVEGCYVW